jgi:hypothetical protein
MRQQGRQLERRQQAQGRLGPRILGAGGGQPHREAVADSLRGRACLHDAIASQAGRPRSADEPGNPVTVPLRQRLGAQVLLASAP